MRWLVTVKFKCLIISFFYRGECTRAHQLSENLPHSNFGTHALIGALNAGSYIDESTYRPAYYPLENHHALIRRLSFETYNAFPISTLHTLFTQNPPTKPIPPHGPQICVHYRACSLYDNLSPAKPQLPNKPTALL